MGNRYSNLRSGTNIPKQKSSSRDFDKSKIRVLVRRILRDTLLLGVHDFIPKNMHHFYLCFSGCGQHQYLGISRHCCYRDSILLPEHNIAI